MVAERLAMVSGTIAMVVGTIGLVFEMIAIGSGMKGDRSRLARHGIQEHCRGLQDHQDKSLIWGDRYREYCHGLRGLGVVSETIAIDSGSIAIGSERFVMDSKSITMGSEGGGPRGPVSDHRPHFAAVLPHTSSAPARYAIRNAARRLRRGGRPRATWSG